jgi:PIN domain nuclease of toxin-antitoxin system
MTVLLDTNSFLWWVADAPRLSRRARKAIESSDCLLSIASCWEMAIKASLGRLQMPSPLDRFLQRQIEVNGFQLLPVSLEHAAAVRDLPFHHRDPFDRLLAAQARHEEIAIVTSDDVFGSYGVKRIW